MEITGVRIKITEAKNRLRAVASVAFDDCFVVHDLRIIEGNKGLFVAMPTRRSGDGTYIDIAHPINTQTRRVIEEKVLNEYLKKVNEEE